MRTELCDLAPDGWELCSIGEVCLRVTSGGTPRRSAPSYYVGGHWPWVTTRELRDGYVDDTEEHITDEAVARSSAKVLPRGTVLVAMYGATVGQLGLLRQPMTCNQACCALIVDQTRADYRYVYYVLLQARAQLRNLATGAAQQNISGSLIRSLVFPFPPLAEQRAIASILGALDDKIELNRKMNETLEAIARAIFKSWFVGFDPVRAIMEGLDTGLPAEIADLFPNSFEESELGGIPRGWGVGSLASYATIFRGPARPYEYPDVLWEHYSIPAYDTNFQPVLELGARIKSAKWRVPPNAVLVSKLNPQVPRIWDPDTEGAENAICSTEFVVLCPLQPDMRSFLLEHVRSLGFQSQLCALITGTTGSRQRVKLGDMEALPAIRPPRNLVATFDRLADPIHRRVRHARAETRTLTLLRDLLLPKLISGQLPIPDAERIVEGVT